MLNKINFKLILIIFFFGLIFSSISIVNHYFIRTYGLDLGMYIQATYQITHFHEVIFTCDISDINNHFLSTHFSLITYLYSPFSLLFGTYSLLILQILFILFGGFYIYKYSLLYYHNNSIFPYLFLIHFFSIWGIYSALSFDFHNNVLASMMIPAFVYYFEKKQFRLSLLVFILIIISKEMMAFFMFFIIIGLYIKNRNLNYLKHSIILIVICVIYSIIVIFYVMPILQHSDHNLQFEKFIISGGGILQNLLIYFKNPYLIFESIFINTSDDSVYDFIKIESIIMFLIAGGIFMLMRPYYIIMILPIFFLKFFNNKIELWGINTHYSIELVPIISISFVYIISKINKYRLLLTIIFVFITLSSTLVTMNSRESKWYNSTNNKFYGKEHYITDLNIKEIKKELNLLDNDSKVSANSSLLPQLSQREVLYHFPIIKDARYIVLLKNKDFWPMNQEEYIQKIIDLRNNMEYKIKSETKDIIIFETK